MTSNAQTLQQRWQAVMMDNYGTPPVALVSGMVGMLMKQFGLTICLAMLISLFDALTIAPMLSAPP